MPPKALLTSITVCAALTSTPPAADAAATSPADSFDRRWGVGRLRAPALLPAGPAGLLTTPGADSGGWLLPLCCCRLAVALDAPRPLLLPAAGSLREAPPLAALP